MYSNFQKQKYVSVKGESVSVKGESISVKGCPCSSPASDSACLPFISRNKFDNFLLLIANDLFCPVLHSFTLLCK